MCITCSVFDGTGTHLLYHNTAYPVPSEPHILLPHFNSSKSCQDSRMPIYIVLHLCPPPSEPQFPVDGIGIKTISPDKSGAHTGLCQPLLVSMLNMVFPHRHLTH